MYEFLYNYIKRKYNVNLVFADTESLVYENKTNDTYKDFLAIKISLILVTIHKIQSFLILSIKKWFVTWKIKSKGKWLVNLLD